MGTVAGLYVYPVKSCKAVELTESKVQLRGLAGDRRWMVVDVDDRFVSQREVGRMARLRAVPTPVGLKLTSEGRGEIDVLVPRGPSREVRVWGSAVQAHDAGQEAATWLSDFLQVPVRLVHMPDESIRPVHPDYSHEGDHVSFADGFPLLAASDASLADLNAKLDAPVPMNRFRPNIVITGLAALNEDRWVRLQVGEVKFRCPKLCGRCIVTTTDQETGERQGEEPIRTLSEYRLIEKAAIFGVNLTPETEGIVKVGDPVTVLESR